MRFLFPNKISINKKIISLLPAVFTGLVLILSGSLNSTIRTTEKEKPVKKRPCCILGVSTRINDAKVILEQICTDRSEMVMHFRTVNMPQICTHPAGTFLLDQNEKQYSMKSFTGMPACGSGKNNENPSIRFTWTFEKFSENVKKFTLEERPTEVTKNMTFWIWKDINVSHCKF